MQILLTSVAGLTLFGNAMQRLHTGRHFHSLNIPWACLSILLLGGCVTQSTEESARSLDDKQEVQEIVGASKVIDCQIINREWIIPGDVKQASIVRSEQNSALVYQAFLRSGPRTVYQPLTPGFSFDGDGFAVGTKDAPNVMDFRAYQDMKKNMWTLSRVKGKDSETYRGMVEASIGRENYRIVLPTPNNQSVLQIWPTLPIYNNVVNVVVRSVTNDDAGGIDADDSSTFFWYRVEANKNSAKLMGRYTSQKLDLRPSGFLMLDRTGEPIAVSVIRNLSALGSSDSMPMNEPSRISFLRIFSANVQERVIFTAKGHLTGLHVSNPIYPGIHLAWSFAPARSARKYIQSTSFNSRTLPEAIFSRNPIKIQEPLLATEVSYEANDPELLFTPTRTGFVPVLGWWGQLEKDSAVVLFPVTKGFRKSGSTVLKSPDGVSLGLNFTPSLAILPPRSFRRVMSFKAAPTAIEKNIIIFSNRDDSAELKKESQLFPCAF